MLTRAEWRTVHFGQLWSKADSSRAPASVDRVVRLETAAREVNRDLGLRQERAGP